MTGATNSVDGVVAEFPMPVLLEIARERTIESLIKIHQLISGNADSVASNRVGGRNGNLILTMTT